MATPSIFEISNDQVIIADHYIASSAADVQFWIAPVKCQVVAIHEAHAVAGDHASAVTATVRRCQGTEAATAGDDLLGTTKIDLKGTALTLQTPALSSTTADLVLEAGDRLSFDVTGNTQNLTGVLLTVHLERV